MLVAGTCIGSGMIALPLMLAKLGLIPSILLMLLIAGITYFTSLVSLELNLQAGEGLSLGELGKKFSGRMAEMIGYASLKLLSFSLLAVFIYAGTSIINKLLSSHHDFTTVATGYALVAVLILLLPIRFVDYINRILFIGLILVVTILVIGLASMISWNDLPLFAEKYTDIYTWMTIIPIVFTSFGFQVIFHTLTNYCNKDAKILKQAFLWGSFLPAVVYIVWTSSILIVIHHENPIFYQSMITGNIEVGDLIHQLSIIAKWQSIQFLVWWISLLAIVTSVLGVGIGLYESLKRFYDKLVSHNILSSVLSSITTILPAYLLAVLIPNAFIIALGFAGMILVIIAIIEPIYLLSRVKIKSYYYPELSYKPLIYSCVVIGIVIIGCEIINLINS